jgi:hypothetical protein
LSDTFHEPYFNMIPPKKINTHARTCGHAQPKQELMKIDSSFRLLHLSAVRLCDTDKIIFKLKNI